MDAEEAGDRRLMNEALRSSVLLSLVSGTPLAYARALDLFLEPPSVPAGIHELSAIAADAVVGSDVSIGPFVTVGAGASLRGCVVTDGVRVPDGASWTGMMLRRADGTLAPGEERVGGLAVAPIRDSKLPAANSQPTPNSQNT